MNLIVYLFYEQCGLEELEVELQVCRAPAIELAFKETRTTVCCNGTKGPWTRTSPQVALCMTNAAQEGTPTRGYQARNTYSRRKITKERGLALNTLVHNRSFRPLPSAANAGSKSREHSEVLDELLSKQDPHRMQIPFRMKE